MLEQSLSSSSAVGGSGGCASGGEAAWAPGAGVCAAWEAAEALKHAAGGIGAAGAGPPAWRRRRVRRQTGASRRFA